MHSSGLYFVHLVYPDLLHLSMPSGYLLSPKGRRASIRVNRSYRLLHVIDCGNYMVPHPENPVLFTPHHDISSTYTNGRHYRMGLVSQEEMDKMLEEYKQSGALDPRLFHTVTFDRQDDGLSRSFETRYATDLLVAYEVHDTKNVPNKEKDFYKVVVNEFVHIYRYVSGDYRPRLLEDCREPMSLDRGMIEYDHGEREKPLDERLGAARQLAFQEHQDKAIYDQQPYSKVPAKEITEQVTGFLVQNDHVAPGQEFLSTARHATFHTKSFKYAILEAFVSAETVIVEFLCERKLARGVSRAKLDDWDKEAGIGYMLNIEVPMLVENMTKEDRQTLGEVDRVRRMRNEIVHKGARPTEQEAQFAVKAVEKLHEALRRWVP